MIAQTKPVPLIAVILAGGSGTRFWPLSRSQYPKQVLRLLGSESLLQATVERLLPLIPLEHLAIVTSALQEDVIRLELYRSGWENLNLWLEPVGRNTAAAVGLAAVQLQESCPQGVMAVFPADHYIQDRGRFLAALETAARWAQAGYLVTLGIPPTKPETGYGYICRGAPLDDQGSAFECARFTEKPSLEKAREFLDSGDYFWNSGMFVFRRDIIWDALGRHLPELQKKLAAWPQADAPARALLYESLPSISLDYGIMEKAARVAMIPVEMGWSDVGTWGALYELFPADADGNVVLGNSCNLDSADCLVVSQERLVATLGLKDTIVVDTPDATLVCHRSHSQEVKDLVARLQDRQQAELIQHTTVERPWGNYTVMDSGLGYKVKKIVVYPGKRLSLQLHRQRAEHWVVVQGTALVTIGPEHKEVHPNESVYVPPHTAHRLENPGTEPLRMSEVPTGPYLEEDDIVRLDDDFWRAGPENQDAGEKDRPGKSGEPR